MCCSFLGRLCTDERHAAEGGFFIEVPAQLRCCFRDSSLLFLLRAKQTARYQQHNMPDARDSARGREGEEGRVSDERGRRPPCNGAASDAAISTPRWARVHAARRRARGRFSTVKECYWTSMGPREAARPPTESVQSVRWQVGSTNLLGHDVSSGHARSCGEVCTWDEGETATPIDSAGGGGVLSWSRADKLRVFVLNMLRGILGPI